MGGNITDNGNGYTLSLLGTGGQIAFNGIVQTSGGVTVIASPSKEFQLNNAANSYTGKTILLGGTLYAATVSNVGVNSALGAPTGANAVIDLYNTTTLRMGTVSTDRSINLAGNGSGTVTLRPSSTTTLNGSLTTTGAGVKTLVIERSLDNGGHIVTLNSAIPDVADGSALSLTLKGWSEVGGGNYSTIILNGTNTFTGPLTITGRASLNTSSIGDLVQIGDATHAGSLGYNSGTGISSYAGAITTSLYLNFIYASAGNQILSGVISGTGALTQSGSGSLTLTAANTFSGATSVSAGKTLTLNNNMALWNSPLTTSTGAIALGSGITTPTFGGLNGNGALASMITSGYGNVTALTLNPQPGVTSTYTGVIADGVLGMTLTKSGLGTQVFGNTQTYTGATTISAGTLQLGTGVTAQNGSVASIVDNAVLAFNNFDAQTYAGNISGTGKLVKNGAGKLILSGANSYADTTTVNTGILQYNSLGAIAGSTGRNITVNAPGAVTLGYTPAVSIQADLLSRINTTSTGAFALTASTSENFDFSSASNNFANLSLGASGSATYSGTLTPNGTTYRLGGGGGTLTFTPSGTYDNTKNLVINGNGLTGIVNLGSGVIPFGSITIGGGTVTNGTLTGTSFSLQAGTVNAVLDGVGVNLVKTGTGTLTLTGVNTYSGVTTVNGGTLTMNGQTGSLVSTNALVFAGTGTFNFDNVGASTSITQGFGPLSFSAGDGTVKITRTAAQNELLTFSSLAARTAGASGSFVLGAGTASAANGFVITAQGAGFIDKGVFFGASSGDNYAWYDASGFVRAMAYPSDTSTATSGATTSLASINHQQITGAISGQNTATFTTLKINGANNFTLAGSQTVTVDSILKTGNNGTPVISGGTGIQASSGAEMLIRTDLASDALTISSPILNNGGNALTKSGAGTLSINSNANSYTGKTSVVAGTLATVNGANYLSNAGVPGVFGAPTGANATIDLYNGTVLQNNGSTPRLNQATDRPLNLAGNGAGTVSIKFNENDASLTFGAVTATGTGEKTLAIYTGCNGNGDREAITISGAIANSSDGSPTSLLVTFTTQSPSYSYVNLPAINTFTGPITLVKGANVSYGYLVIGGTRAPASSGGSSTSGSGQLGSGTYSAAISLDTSTILNHSSTANQVLSGIISGAGALLKEGTGSLTLSAANTFSGATTVSASRTLTLNNNLALQNSPLETANGAIVLGSGVTAPTIGGLNGSRALATVITTGYSSVTALTLNPQAGASPSYSGVITNGADGMTLTKSGPGTQTLTGANTYSGGTTVSAGTLAVSGTGTLGSGDVSVAFGGMLSLSTSNAISNDKRLTLVSGAVVTLAAGVNETVNELYIDGKLQKKGKWGTSGSSPLPANIDNIHFTGTGILTVLKGPPDGTMISFY
jgi:autotransporter-associated beta strand protein